jgi:pimeloyl-ACP methyl ester carboxylesterase
MDVPVITVPTLYVWGTEDVAVGSAAAMATAKYVDAPYQFEMLEDVSHWVTEQESDTLTALLIRHLVEHPETDDDLG